MTIKELLQLGKDLIEIYFGRSSTEMLTIEEHLKASASTIERITSKYPLYLKSICAYSIDLVLKECEIKKVMFIDIDYIGTPSYEEFEIDLDKKVYLPINGTFYVIYKSKPFAIKLDLERYSPPIGYEIQYTKDNEKLARELSDKVEDYIKNKNFLKNKIITPNGDFVRVEDYSFDDLIVPDKLLNDLKLNVVNLFEKSDIYKANNIPIRRGILFAGSAGVGKTMSLKILSKMLKTTVMWVTASSINNSRDIKTLFEMARELSPTVILFEDIDLYCQDREHHDSTNPILGEFLNQMDGLSENNGVVTLATTNYPEKIEKALKDRHNRFDKTITFELPDEECRIRLLTLYLKGLKTKGIDVSNIAKTTAGYSGAQLKELIMVAQLFAVEKNSLDKNKKIVLKTEHIELSMGKVPKIKNTTVGFGAANEDEIPELTFDEVKDRIERNR